MPIQNRQDLGGAIVQIGPVDPRASPVSLWWLKLSAVFVELARVRGWSSVALDNHLIDDCRTFFIEGNCAFGMLRGERGRHRCLTSAGPTPLFELARVEVWPLIDPDRVRFDPSDLRVTVFRRRPPIHYDIIEIEHLPTGTRVVCRGRDGFHLHRKALSLLHGQLAMDNRPACEGIVREYSATPSPPYFDPPLTGASLEALIRARMVRAGSFNR